MTTERDDLIISLLRSIDGTLKQILNARRSTAAKQVADDRDLDGQYGDPEVRLNPRDWTGESMKTRKFSQCPAEFLDMLADALDYFAGKDEAEGKTTNAGKPAAPYRRRDAARARGWAARVRAGKVKQVPRAVASGTFGRSSFETDDQDDWR